MATSPTSYLQTLPSDEVTTFVASLLKVKQHLSHEIQWFSEQLQQKTVQLHGIEALLAESGVESAPAPVAAISAPSLDQFTPAAIAAPQEPQVAPQPTQLTKAAGKQLRSKPGAKAATKGKATKPKAPGSKSHPTRTEGPELRQFLQPQFRDTPLSEAIIQVLGKAAEPLSPDNIASELYEGLSTEDYGRAKRSLVSVLSLGRSKGKWQSPGRGLYESAAATA